MSNIVFSKIKDAILLKPNLFSDERGSFLKYFQYGFLQDHFNTFDIKESYYTISKKNVIRGLHFQVPPYDHHKMVTCISGRIFDVILDLRKDSSTYGQHETFILDDETREALYIPTGCAHGFCVLSDSATVLYHVTSEYSPEHDSGVLWNSAHIKWPTSNPILSARDRSFPKLDQI